MRSHNDLRARVERLENVAAHDLALPCAGCSLLHTEAVFSLEQLQRRHGGLRGPLGPICGCECCRPFVENLASRHDALGGAA